MEWDVKDKKFKDIDVKAYYGFEVTCTCTCMHR